MGRLYDGVAAIEAAIVSRGLDAARVKGEIGMRAGFFLAIIFPHTPDDAAKLSNLQTAAKDVLGIELNV